MGKKHRYRPPKHIQSNNKLLEWVESRLPLHPVKGWYFLSAASEPYSEGPAKSVIFLFTDGVDEHTAVVPIKFVDRLRSKRFKGRIRFKLFPLEGDNGNIDPKEESITTHRSIFV